MMVRRGGIWQKIRNSTNNTRCIEKHGLDGATENPDIEKTQDPHKTHDKNMTNKFENS